MKNKIKIFTALFLTLNIMPVFAETIGTVQDRYAAEANALLNDARFAAIPADQRKAAIQAFLQRLGRTEEDIARLDEKQNTYEEAKENEQSIENRTLTALTTAATGIGGMELAQGLAEQKADKDAAADMAAYIATMRCTYGDNQQVKAGTSQIELPGGNNSDLMKLRSEYFALAADLKTRKDALGLAPGIESQEILDKAQSGLYDDESITGTDGTYASLYRAQMLDSEKDKSQIEEDAKKSKTRVIAGGVAAGVGVVGGAVGDSLINGELHDLIEEKRNDDNE